MQMINVKYKLVFYPFVEILSVNVLIYDSVDYPYNSIHQTG